MDNNMERLNNIIASYSSKEITFSKDINLIDDLGFDSIVLMEMIIKIEQEFDLEFDDELLIFDYIASYAFLSEFVHKKVKGDFNDNAE